MPIFLDERVIQWSCSWNMNHAAGEKKHGSVGQIDQILISVSVLVSHWLYTLTLVPAINRSFFTRASMYSIYCHTQTHSHTHTHLALSLIV